MAAPPEEGAHTMVEPAKLKLHAGIDDVGIDYEASLARQLHEWNCTGLFVDAGANIGMHARFLFEPQQYPSNMYNSLFNAHFGPEASRGTLCAIEFEPNPAHRTRHERLAAAYAARGWRVLYAPYGVGAARGNLTFYHNDEPDGKSSDKHEEWGFSVKKRQGELSIPVVVPTIDLARFLALYAGRDGAFSDGESRSRRPITTVVKMDIEGEEFAVLPHLLARSTLCAAVDAITVEFHYWLAPYQLDGAVGGVEVSSEGSAQDVGAMLRMMARDAGRAAGCRTAAIDELDDETYLHDRNAQQLTDPTPGEVGGIPPETPGDRSPKPEDAACRSSTCEPFGNAADADAPPPAPPSEITNVPLPTKATSLGEYGPLAKLRGQDHLLSYEYAYYLASRAKST